jgi:hypothetical protein
MKGSDSEHTFFEGNSVHILVPIILFTNKISHLFSVPLLSVVLVMLRA